MSKKSKRMQFLLSGLVSVCALTGCVARPAPSAYLDYQTKTELTFPLTGEALIGTGGRTLESNPDHIVLEDQRFALDIVALAPGSFPPERDKLVEKVLSGELSELYKGDNYYDNSKHYCFDRQIIAPGAGVVIDTKDGVQENQLGKRNTKDIPGNYVVIDHLNGEYSMLAHFLNGSVAVQKGDEVAAGTPIGKCGNTGHSNLPHLHYHLQTTPHWHKGKGLPAQFLRYFANGEFVERGEPIQGEIILNLRPAVESR